MNLKRNQLITDLLHLFLQFIILYMLTALVLRSFFSDAAFKALLLLPVPFLSYAIQRRMKHIWSFLLLHISLLSIYVMLAEHPLLKAVYGIYIAGLSIYAFYQRHKSACQTMGLPYPVLILVFINICSYYLHMPDIQKLCFYLSLAYIILYVLTLYLSNLSRFAHNHADLQNVPFQQIRSSNHVLTLFLSGLFLFIMVVFSYLPLGTMLSALGKVLLGLIRWLVSLLPQSKEKPAQMTPVEETAAPAFDLPPSEPSRFMEMISEILQWIATILAIAGFLALILYGIYCLYRYFYLTSEKTCNDEVVFISPLTKKERTAKADRHSHRLFFGRSNNDTIRKLFAKAVSAKANGYSKLSRSMTPYQLSEFALGSSKDIRNPAELEDKKQQLTASYEKARYSDKLCSREEVRKVKELLK